MTRHDPIIAADLAEEQAAATELRNTKSSHELGLVWAISCEHFAGPARERLRTVFTEMLGKHAPMSRAG